jgi:hypothetical protein
METRTARVEPLAIPIALAALITAGIHFWLAPQEDGLMKPGFVVAGIAFVGPLIALLVPVDFLARLRPLALVALGLTAVVTIVGFVVVEGFHFDPLAIVAKAAELSLIILVITYGMGLARTSQGRRSGEVEAARLRRIA